MNDKDMSNCVNLPFTAYVLDELPFYADILLGLDQIGNTIGLNIPLDRGKIELSFKNSRNQIIKFQIEKNSGERIESNNLMLMASMSGDGIKQHHKDEIILDQFPGGKLEQQADTKEFTIDNNRSVDNILQVVDKELMSSPVAGREIDSHPIALAVDNKKEDSSDKVKDITFIKNKEIESIKAAIVSLNVELNELVEIENQLNQLTLSKNKRGRKEKRKLKQTLDSKKKKSEVEEMIKKFYDDLVRVKKSYKLKLNHIRKSNMRSLKRKENILFKTLLKDYERYVVNNNNKVSDSNSENISFLDLLEAKIDDKSKSLEEKVVL
jgi:hypothetical protein